MSYTTKLEEKRIKIEEEKESKKKKERRTKENYDFLHKINGITRFVEEKIINFRAGNLQTFKDRTKNIGILRDFIENLSKLDIEILNRSNCVINQPEYQFIRILDKYEIGSSGIKEIESQKMITENDDIDHVRGTIAIEILDLLRIK